ncbi:putative carboxylesterase [Trifolium repens]|nr:putative carboxylesterase [Trifolium repens]
MNANPPPWKNTNTGRDVPMSIKFEEGIKSRNKRLRVGSTMTSEEDTPSTKLGLGATFLTMKSRRRRSMVSLERRERERTKSKIDMERRAFHGRFGFGVEAMVE